MKHHKLGSLNDSDCLEAKIKMWAGLAPSEAVRENLFQASPLASGGLGAA
jgi:hypothetical protein